MWFRKSKFYYEVELYIKHRDSLGHYVGTDQLRDFYVYFKNKKTIDDISEDDLKEYYEFLWDFATPYSYQGAIHIIRQFFRFHFRAGHECLRPEQILLRGVVHLNKEATQRTI